MSPKSAYRLGLALAVATPLVLLLTAGALGIIGSGGRQDRVYVVVLAVVLLGSALARLRATAMVLVMLASALTEAVVTATVLLAGVHEDVGGDVGDLVGVTAMFVALFLAAAWLFHLSARPAVSAPTPG